MEDKHIKILFKLDKDVDDYPPDDYETLWAKVVTNENFAIDNIPFFVREISDGDVVQAERSGGEYIFTKLITKSEFTTLRIICFDSSNIADIREKLSEMGCETEYMKDYEMIAVNIPCDIKYAPIEKYLIDIEKSGLIEYEESAFRHNEEE